jgi:hypothetical protein
MKSELKDEWVRALRSGDYKQGNGALLKDGKYCCLGVLADILEPEAWQPSTDGRMRWNDRIGTLVDNFQDLRPKDQHKLIDMNDGSIPDGHDQSPINIRTFDEIADWIEANVEVTE